MAANPPLCRTVLIQSHSICPVGGELAFFPYCIREGDPSFLFLYGEGMVVSFASPLWNLLEVVSVWCLLASFMRVSMFRMVGIAGA